MRKVSQKTKWDRKKKKYVSLQSTLDKNKKIKTESGQYINASYKSDLYAKWLKNSKANHGQDDDENDDGDDKNDDSDYYHNHYHHFYHFHQIII